jgi:hypothetical protein
MPKAHVNHQTLIRALEDRLETIDIELAVSIFFHSNDSVGMFFSTERVANLWVASTTRSKKDRSTKCAHGTS